MHGESTLVQDWPLFTIEYFDIREAQALAAVVSDAKDWRRAQQMVAEHEGISINEARARLLCATQACSPAGWPHLNEFGDLAFTNQPGQTGIMINVATWAMDNGLAL